MITGQFLLTKNLSTRSTLRHCLLRSSGGFVTDKWCFGDFGVTATGGCGLEGFAGDSEVIFY